MQNWQIKHINRFSNPNRILNWRRRSPREPGASLKIKKQRETGQNTVLTHQILAQAQTQQKIQQADIRKHENFPKIWGEKQFILLLVFDFSLTGLIAVRLGSL